MTHRSIECSIRSARTSMLDRRWLLPSACMWCVGLGGEQRPPHASSPHTHRTGHYALVGLGPSARHTKRVMTGPHHTCRAHNCVAIGLFLTPARGSRARVIGANRVVLGTSSQKSKLSQSQLGTCISSSPRGHRTSALQYDYDQRYATCPCSINRVTTVSVLLSDAYPKRAPTLA